jgi:cytochrome oxidase assembly protein ShyY1
MPQDHFNYAATWWTLSAASLALAVKAVRQGMRPR